MNKIKQYLVLAVLVLTTFTLRAQDIHFSQFYASPLNLNPAFTGLINNCYRATAIYRNQWNSWLKPDGLGYHTISASIDAPFLRNRLGNDFIGGGLVLVGDQAGDAGLQEIGVLLSGAYHKALGGLGKHRLSAGFQFGYVQKRLDLTKLIFPLQWNGQIHDPGKDNGEGSTGLQNSTSYFDLRMGLLWFGPIKSNISAYGGISLFHLTKPKESFFSNVDSNRLPSRFVMHGGARIKTGQKISILPNFIAMRQSKITEVNIGTSVEYDIPDNNATEMGFSLGAWIRLTGKEPNFNGKISESAVISAGFVYHNWSLGISYDVNISDLQVVSNNAGGFEISLIYMGSCRLGTTVKRIQVPCQRF